MPTDIAGGGEICKDAYFPVQSLFRARAVPSSAGLQYSAVTIAWYDLVLHSNAISRDISGFHFSAGIIWQGTAQTRDRDYYGIGNYHKLLELEKFRSLGENSAYPLPPPIPKTPKTASTSMETPGGITCCKSVY